MKIVLIDKILGLFIVIQDYNKTLRYVIIL